MERIRIRLRGSFRVETEAGDDLTPRGAKARAVLAILAEAPDLSQGRVPLRRLLWSDRSDGQAAVSLRQTLSEIRRALGAREDVLVADRRTVRLDRARVVADRSARGLVLEDLHVRDPRFEAWLAERRGEGAAGPAGAQAGGPALGAASETAGPSRLRHAGTPAVAVRLDGTAETPELALVEGFVLDSVARGARENYRIAVLRAADPSAAPPRLRATVQAFRLASGEVGIRACLDEVGHGTLYSEIVRLASRGAPDPEDLALLALGNRLLTAVGKALRRGPAGDAGGRDIDMLTDRAVAGIFSVKATRLAEAKDLLHQAIEVEPRGLQHGWLAQLYAFQYVERFVPLDELRECSEAACAHAIELEPDNSNVLAAVASSRLVLHRNLAASGELARLAVEANPANPLAWLSLSAALLYYGRIEEAHAKAQRARALAAGSRYRFWTEFQASLTAATQGRTLDAIQGSELSSALNAQFRPPLRYLSAIYAGAQMYAEAASSFRRLGTVETDVTVERFSDVNYPVSLMRKRGMLDPVRLAEAVARSEERPTGT